MLAARDQENLVHGQHKAAGAKSVASQTPGHYGRTANGHGRATERKRGDENAVLSYKAANWNKDAFVTPSAPRNRAPLGAKTTNAKVKAFQTPAPATNIPESRKTQLRSTSARKPRLKIHRTEPVEAELNELGGDDDEEPDIEYCPPKITELPDTPDEPWQWGPDKTFPQFEGGNLTRGWYDNYTNPTGPDGLTRWQREQNAKDAESDKRSRELLDRAAKEAFPEDLDLAFAQVGFVSEAEHPKANLAGGGKEGVKHNKTSALDSRSAAQALSQGAGPRFAAQTAATKAKKTGALPERPSTQTTKGTLASRSTIGYSAGRKISSTIKSTKSTDKDVADKKRDGRPSGPVKTDKELMNELLTSERRTEDDEDDDEVLFPEYNFESPSTGSPLDDDFVFAFTPLWN